MLSFISYCALFSCGIMAACIDWNKFVNEFFKFDAEIIVTNKVLNPDTGLPTGQVEQVKLESTFDPTYLLPLGLFLLALYYLVVFMPAKIIFHYLEGTLFSLTLIDKYTPVIAKFGLNRITYRKEMKRRGSWPLAYSTEFANFQEA